jgi:hypothetical protein
MDANVTSLQQEAVDNNIKNGIITMNYKNAKN